MLVLGFYSGLLLELGRLPFILCVVSLLSSRITASALVWFSNYLKYLVSHFFISLSTMFICRSSKNNDWITFLEDQPVCLFKS
jgi:hypothetical protein